LIGMLWVVILAGTIVFAVLLPFIPLRSFSLQGGILGMAAALVWLRSAGIPLGSFNTLSLVLLMSVVSGYLAFNFTGNSTYTSISGVRRELRYALPAFLSVVVVIIVLQLVERFL
jgi:hypothetical protein